MDCLRNHGPRMKFRLGHAKVNNPPRSEAVSRGTTQRRRRRRRRRGNGSRAIPTSFLPVLEAVGRLACRRISACLPRGWRGKWSSSVRYGLVIPPRSLSLSLSLSSNQTCENRYLRVPLDSDKITMIFVIHITSASCFRSRENYRDGSIRGQNPFLSRYE